MVLGAAAPAAAGWGQHADPVGSRSRSRLSTSGPRAAPPCSPALSFCIRGAAAAAGVAAAAVATPLGGAEALRRAGVRGWRARGAWAAWGSRGALGVRGVATAGLGDVSGGRRRGRAGRAALQVGSPGRRALLLALSLRVPSARL